MMIASAFDFNLYILAGNPNASADLLAELAAHPNARIRRRVAENPNTPPQVLRLLSKDVDSDVLIAVAGNSASPFSVAEELAVDPEAKVRLGIAQELNTPVRILQMLQNDEDPYVRHEAGRTLEILESRQNLRHMDKFSMRKSRTKREAKSSCRTRIKA